MENVTVVEVIDGVPSQVYLYTGEHNDIVNKAEQKLLRICHKNFENFDDYTDADILDDGYAQYGSNCSVAIVWPTIFNSHTIRE